MKPALNAAVGMYETFHDRIPDRVLALPVKMPRSFGKVGRVALLAYRSAKWTGRSHAYVHEYESDVWFCEPLPKGRKRIAAGRWPRQLVELGEVMDVIVAIDDGFARPRLGRGTRLCATPDGKRIVLYDPRRGIVAALLGPAQKVTERGIEG